MRGLAGHSGQEIAAVFAGGFLGALARGALLEWAPVEPESWPWATFVANVAGTALLAWLMLHLYRELPVSARRRRLAEPGLCGALTTFSALQLELLRMLDGGHLGLAAAYAAASIAAGLALARAGVILTRRWRPAGDDVTDSSAQAGDPQPAGESP